MNKINNKNKIYSVTFGLGMLAILAFSITLSPSITSADIGGYVTPYGVTAWNTNIQNNNQYNGTYNSTPAYVAPAPTMTVYSNSTNPNTTTVSNTTVAKAKTANLVTSSSVVVAKTNSSENSDLVANAIFGSNSFMPSGIIQWVLFAILVLLVVMVVRRLYGGDEKYHSKPMKHA